MREKKVIKQVVFLLINPFHLSLTSIKFIKFYLMSIAIVVTIVTSCLASY